MMTQRMRNYLSFLSGAGVGAAMMYLMDPEQGEQRRQRVKARAADATHATGEAMGTAWHAARQRADRYGRAAAAGLGAVSSTLAGRATELKHYAADSRLGQWLAQGGRREGFFSRMTDRRSSRMGALTMALAAVGCVALGVGAMYLMDPESGARRRAKARNRIVHGYGYMSDRIKDNSRGLLHRASDLAGETRTWLSPQRRRDRRLSKTVRSQIETMIADPSAIDVDIEAGKVTLAGTIPATDVDRLLRCVRSIEGVEEVNNRLDVHQSQELMH